MSLEELIKSGQVTFFELSRHADVAAALRDPAMSSNEDNWEAIDVARQKTQSSPLTDVLNHWMLFMDPPDHSRMRSLVNKAFTARTVERLRSRIQELTDELLDAAAESGEIEVMEDFAFPLPVRVVCELLGVPREEQGRFRQASQQIASVLDIGPVSREVLDAATPFVDFLRVLVDERRANPGDDLLSALIAARDEQDRLTELELLGTVSLILEGGFETTMNLIGNGVSALLRNPDELARLREDPSLIGSAVEEVLRFEPPVMVTARTSLEDREIDGTAIHRGQQGIMMLAVANKDPEVFADPYRFDVGRDPNPHLAFGGGHHFCPGAALARLEGQIAIGSLVRRFPNLRLLEEPRWRQTATLHGLEELRVGL